MNTRIKSLTQTLPVLRELDWTFRHRTTHISKLAELFDCRRHHWYPATFIPEIPYALVEILSHPKATIWDPFAGIGTTFVQSLLLSRRAFAYEICEVAVTYLRSLFTLLDPQINHIELRNNTWRHLDRFDRRFDYRDAFHGSTLIEELEPWYERATFRELCFLIHKFHSIRDGELKDLWWILVSGILGTTSSQDRGWGCVADNVLPRNNQLIYKRPIELFRQRATSLIKSIGTALATADDIYAKVYSSMARDKSIVHIDSRRSGPIRNGTIDLVVTSPPYPNMADYVKSQRLQYYFIGHEPRLTDVKSDLALEIGARGKRKRQFALSDYAKDMNKVMANIYLKLKPGGVACLVLPFFDSRNSNNSNRKAIIQNTVDATVDLGFCKEAIFDRHVPPMRRSHNIYWTTLQRERIYVLRKK